MRDFMHQISCKSVYFMKLVRVKALIFPAFKISTLSLENSCDEKGLVWRVCENEDAEISIGLYQRI